MAPDMLCKLPKVPSTDNFEDLLEDMELDIGLLRELLEEVSDDNVDIISTMETVVNNINIPPSKEKKNINGDSSHVLLDHESQLLFYEDFDYWISQEIGEMPCLLPRLSSFENEMMPFWQLENPRIEEVMVDDDTAYVELWED